MGIFWDLYQESQLEDQRNRSEGIEDRISDLEQELHETRQLLAKTLKVLEEHVGQDIDGDGLTG